MTHSVAAAPGTTPTVRMDDKVVVITGGNSGIGLETAVSLAGRGAQVVLGCRNREKAAAAVEEIRRRSNSELVESRPLDLSDLQAVRTFASSLSDLDRIDVLINNAGLMLDTRAESAQGFEATFATNHLGHFLLTELVLDQVRSANHGRIVNVASTAHRLAPRGITWADLDRRTRYFGWTVYAQSKLANILHARELAHRLAETDVVVHSLHPGNVASGFGADGDLHGFNDLLVRAGHLVLISPQRGARTSVHVATSPEALRSSGDYWFRCARARPTRAARDDAAAARLRAVSEAMIAASS